MHRPSTLFRASLLLSTLVLVALLLVPAQAEARTRDIAFAGPADTTPHEIIVRFAPRAEFDAAAQGVAHLRAGTARVRGLRGMPGYDLVRMPGNSSADVIVRRYAADPSVLYAEPNYPVSVEGVPNDTRFGEQWGLLNTGQSGGTPGADIDAMSAWQTTTGSTDVIVAVIDTGVEYEHTDLAPNMWSGVGWNFVAGNDDPMDYHGHGTHVAGTIAAAGNDGFGVAGVAWDAQIMALKALDDNGSGWVSNIAEAVTYASNHGADVINMSLGGSTFSQAFYDAIAASDALVVAAAGNSGKNTDSSPSYPAAYDLPNIVSVAATDRTDTLASFSNYGAASVDLGAPGVGILSTVPGHTFTATPVFTDSMDTLDAWATDYYRYNPWTHSTTVFASPSGAAGHTPPGGYVANEQSWIDMHEFVSLAEADSMAVSFSARLDTLTSDDGLLVAALPEGGHWVGLGYVDRSTGGAFKSFRFENSTLAGKRVVIAFVFFSGSTPGGNGVWIDDVVVESLVRDGGADYTTAHAYMSGTSMAAPHVAGVAALLKAYRPDLGTPALKAAILEGVEPLPSLASKTVTGGRLDAAGALLAAGPPPNRAPLAADSAYVAEAGMPLSVPAPGVLAGASDPDGDELAAEVASEPLAGAVALAADGSFVYTPPAGFLGQDTFAYRAFDGEAHSEPATVTIAVEDTIAPTSLVTLEAVPQRRASAWFTSSPEISIEATDTGSGVERIEWRLAEGDWLVEPGSVLTVSDLPEGTHELSWRAIDLAGNAEEVQSLAVAIDSTPPVTSDDTVALYLGAATVSLTANDTLSGVAATYYTLNGAEELLYTEPVTVDAAGSHTLSYYSVDVAGNAEEPVTVAFTIEPAVIEIAGASRWETAVLASAEAYPEGLDPAGERAVVIATGRNWPDALGGSALAGAVDGPILLVNTNTVPAVVLPELIRLGAEKAYVVGGDVAVGEDVVTALEGAGLVVERVAGGNRYTTADAVALKTIEVLQAGTGFDGTAFVATGAAYADAVAAAPLAAANGWPLYLASPGGVRAATLAAMADVTDVLVLGGTGAVTESTFAQLETEFDGADQSVDRLWGTTRYGTAVAIATYGVEHAGLGWKRVGIATGQDYPDALAGGVLQGKVGSVMLLTRSSELSPESAVVLDAHKTDITAVTYFGGTLAVSQTVRTVVAQTLE